MRVLKKARPAPRVEPPIEVPERVNSGLPAWALPRAAWKLIVEAIKHPNTGTLIVADPIERTVRARRLTRAEEHELTGRELPVEHES